MESGIEKIGRYEIVQFLGEGGMGTVYLARDPKFNGRHVAIKLLRDTFDSNEIRERFWREAQAAGQLHHPNIVTIFDWEEHAGRPFIAMEYIRGETVARLIERGAPVSMSRKLEIIEGLCAGLACAHRDAIIHRDIKPANVMVDEHGAVKILDFGIARVASSQLTVQQEMLGTVSYMSPEQLQGAPLDHRSDMFAASALAYELLTGRKAFSGTLQEVARGILMGEVPPMSGAGVTIPRPVEQAILKGLARRPEQRYDDMAAMQRDVSSVRALLAGADPAPASDSAPWDKATVVISGRSAEPPAPPKHAASSTTVRRPVIAIDQHELFGAASDMVVDAPQNVSGLARPWLFRGPVAAAAVTAVVLLGWLFFSRGSSTSPATPATGPAASEPRKTIVAAPPSTSNQPQEAGATGTAKPSANTRAPAQPGTPAGSDNSARGQQTTSVAPGQRPDVPPAREDTAPPRVTAPVTAPPETPPSPQLTPPVNVAPPSPATRGPEPAPPPPVEPLTLSPADDAGIRAVLRAYEAAFDNLSTPALKAAQPSLTRDNLAVFDRRFLDNKSYHVEIVAPRIGLVSRTRARVDCSITTTFTPKEGQARTSTSKAVIVLDRTDAGWLIDSVRGPR